jgi:glycerol kinase
MQGGSYILAIDQGTTGTRVILFDHDGEIAGDSYREVAQFYPEPGWVEHDPNEYWNTVLACSAEVFEKSGTTVKDVAAIGITNQRETTILWDKETGEPVSNAIVWMCRRTARMCDDFREQGLEPQVREKTGLLIDAYFSATKIRWIMDNVPGVREGIAAGRILAGNIDSWLIWKLSGGKSHVTDYSNASRTLLLNIYDLAWDQGLLDGFGIPESILPALMPSSGTLAVTAPDAFFGAEIPVAGVAGDQHAATFGQTCFDAGMAKNSYGTALALFMNTGTEAVVSKNGLTTNLGWRIGDVTEYALEGVVFNGGSAIQWLRDGLRIIEDSAEASVLAAKVEDTGGVYMVPAFTGLCAPYWDMYARGLIVGITRGTSREQIARATMESIAYRTRDVMDAMASDRGEPAPSLRVDGGATKSDFLMQFQADILGIPVERPSVTEMAARGAAYLAGLGVGFWKSKDEVASQWKLDRVFEPTFSKDRRDELYAGWQKAVDRSLRWAE